MRQCSLGISDLRQLRIHEVRTTDKPLSGSAALHYMVVAAGLQQPFSALLDLYKARRWWPSICQQV